MRILLDCSPVNLQNHSTTFKSYTSKEICADLCKGACCNHGTPMNVNLKKIADKICTQYHTISDDLKTTILIKAPIVKWIVGTENPDINTLNNLANTYIDAISRENDTEKKKLLYAELDKINKKLAEIDNDSETYLPISNPELKSTSLAEIQNGINNVCIFKDHGKTNLCTIYNGAKADDGRIIPRPSPCLKVGSDEMPCPWHHPEKYVDIYRKTKEMLARAGYWNIPQLQIQQYIAREYNLNEVFNEKIWQPYLKTLDRQI